MLTNPTRVATVAKLALAILCCVIIGVGLFYVAVPYLGTKANTTFGKVGGKKSEDPNARPAPQIGIQVGNKALEIEGEDIQGNKFKLSDYRGKVVMLDFWGNWWGPCRAMYPHERSLVQRLQNKSFALIGVNSDDTRETAKSAVTDEHLTWRSFFDGKGGRIAHQWQVMAFPTIYLIDHKGLVRRKYEGNPGDAVLDREIDELVKEAETQESS